MTTRASADRPEQQGPADRGVGATSTYSDAGSLWSAFATTTIRIGTGAEEVVIADQQSYTLPWNQVVHVMTGWNPGRLASDSKNAAANEALQAVLRLTGLPVYEAVGCSIDGIWAEPGYAIVGLDRAAATDIGRRLGQVAIFEIAATSVVVVGCFEERLIVRHHPPPPMTGLG